MVSKEHIELLSLENTEIARRVRHVHFRPRVFNTAAIVVEKRGLPPQIAHRLAIDAEAPAVIKEAVPTRCWNTNEMPQAGFDGSNIMVHILTEWLLKRELLVEAISAASSGIGSVRTSPHTPHLRKPNGFPPAENATSTLPQAGQESEDEFNRKS